MQSVFSNAQPTGNSGIHSGNGGLDGQPPADAWYLSRLPRSGSKDHGERRSRAYANAMGNALSSAVRRPACHKHTQHEVSTLAPLARPRKSVPSAVQFFLRVRRYCSEKDPGLVLWRREPPIDGVRRDLDHVDGAPGNEGQPGRWAALSFRLFDFGTKRSRRGYSSQSNAGHPDDLRGNGCLDAGVMVRGFRASTPTSRRRP